jgi:hypothetical protein
MYQRNNGAPSGDQDRQLPLMLDELDPPLPPRAIGVLKRAGLETADKLAAASDTDLLALFVIGQPTLKVIRAVLTGQRPRHPLRQIPLEELRTALGARLYNQLRRAQLRTAEEVAAVTNATLRDLRVIGRQSVRSSRDITFQALAKDYTTGAPVRLDGEQLREVIAFTAELALYAVEHNDTVLRRRTRSLLQVLAPGFPDPESHDPRRPSARCQRCEQLRCRCGSWRPTPARRPNPRSALVVS